MIGHDGYEMHHGKKTPIKAAGQGHCEKLYVYMVRISYGLEATVEIAAPSEDRARQIVIEHFYDFDSSLRQDEFEHDGRGPTIEFLPVPKEPA